MHPRSLWECQRKPLCSPLTISLHRPTRSSSGRPLVAAEPKNLSKEPAVLSTWPEPPCRRMPRLRPRLLTESAGSIKPEHRETAEREQREDRCICTAQQQKAAAAAAAAAIRPRTHRQRSLQGRSVAKACCPERPSCPRRIEADVRNLVTTECHCHLRQLRADASRTSLREHFDRLSFRGKHSTHKVRTSWCVQSCGNVLAHSKILHGTTGSPDRR